MACVVELHLDIKDVDEWLLADVGYGKINELLRQRGHQEIPTSTMGRHREKCLGLPKKAITREVPPARKLEAPKPELPLPSDTELVSEVKRVLYWRLKTEPQKVQTSSLASILAASMREKKPEAKDTFTEMLEQLGQDESAEAGASGEDVEEESDSPEDGEHS